jgi:PhoH-like ATPase
LASESIVLKSVSPTAQTARKTYVLDTSVLLADPGALSRFAEHEVIIPITVIGELESKRDHPELGYFARAALRCLDDLRLKSGRLDKPIDITDQGGTLSVELNHADPSKLPAGFLRDGSNDSRILAIAKNLMSDGRQVVLVTKDLPLRVKASSVGVEAQEYRAELATSSGWSGMVEESVGSTVIDALYENEKISHEIAKNHPCHTGVVLHSEKGSALARVTPDKHLQLVRGDRSAFGLHGRSAEQRVALDILLDPEVGIVSLGLEAVLEKRLHKKVVIFRPLYAVGGQELGYLPGTENEKMSPWAQAVFDTLGALVSQQVLDEVVERGLIEVLPLTHIRGRSLHDSFVIVDEAQSLERGVLLTVLSRIGQGSRVVLTHDVAQRDNLRVGRHDGVVAVVESLKGHPLFAHITLTRSERSQIAALVTELLEEPINFSS